MVAQSVNLRVDSLGFIHLRPGDARQPLELYHAALSLTPNGPASGGYGSVSADLGKELVPSLRCGLDNRIIRVEDAIGEVCLTKILPDIFRRVQLGAAGRNE